MAISPAHSNNASSGAMKDAFGVWIEEIEKNTPAEWLEEDNRDMFRDVSEGADKYFQKYIVRVIKNFMTGNPEYETIDEVEFDNNGDVDESQKLSVK